MDESINTSCYGFVKNSLEKVWDKTWVHPLGKALLVTVKIVDVCGTFGPGVATLGSAASFGASLLNPEPTLHDLEEKLDELNERLSLATISIDDSKERSKGPIIYFIEDRSPSRDKQRFCI